MITIEQCRAARGLLSWTQQDLAEASGLSKTAINNFEKGHSDIKVDSLRAIRLAFESANVDFIGSDGVKKRRNSAEIFQNELAFEELLDDILDTLKTDGGEVLILNSLGNLSHRASAEKIGSYQKTAQKLGIQERTINTDSAPYDWGNDEDTKTMPAATMKASITSFVYGPKLAFILWDTNIIVCINSADASNTERRRFEYFWNRGKAGAEDNGQPDKGKARA